MSAPSSGSNSFVSARLPWLIGAGALGVYLITLNHWVSLYSLENVARASRWLWRPQLEQPLNAVLLFPFRFLPEARIPLALNAFNAGCAALVLVFLARSVALLPQDLSRDEPFSKNLPSPVLSIPGAWLPPLLAAVLCGLQLTFWEHATSASGEMVDLLVFAYVIRCLLEFRLDSAQSWLSRAAFVYGLGMANHWSLIGFLPLFLIAILRAKGYGPFRERAFLLRMSLWGLAGLSLYLLLPTLQSLSSHSHIDFWTALKAHLKSQKEMLGYLRRPVFRIFLLASFLPIIVLSIRWKSHTVQFGDDTPLGVFIAKATVNLVHALFLVIPVWIALDPAFGPRNLRLGTSMLGFYYISALVFGYCAGFFLLFGAKDSSGAPASAPVRPVRSPGLSFQLLPATGVLAVCALAFTLVWRNLGQIVTTNGPTLRQLADNLYADLPKGKSVVVSDDPVELLLLRAGMNINPAAKAPLLLEVPSLASVQYRLFLARQFKSRWPGDPQQEPFGPGKVLKLISSLAAREPVVYLRPNFGMLFEFFNGRPKGFIDELAPRQQTKGPMRDGDRNPARTPNTLTDDEIALNEQLWQRRWAESIKTLSYETKERPKYPQGAAGSVMKRLSLASEPNFTASFAGAAYSRRLNDWGVRMQRLSHAGEAMDWFQRAIDLNPENLSAHINLEYAKRREHGDNAPLKMAAVENEFSELFVRQKNWREILGAGGPVDEPSYLFRTGRVLLASGNARQAITELSRCAELAPEWAAPKLWGAQGHIQLREFAPAVAVTESIQQVNLGEDGVGLARLLECRATALSGLGHTNEATACIESFVTQHSRHWEVLSVAAEIYDRNGQFENELTLLEELLKREPSRVEWLARKGLAQMQLARYDAAVETLTAALAIAPSNDQARLLRAVAALGDGELDAARADYQKLLTTASNQRNALFGLGTVAWRQQDTNLAIRYYQQFLSAGVSGTRQDTLAAERLREFQQGKAVER